jgi:hypothetical protein
MRSQRVLQQYGSTVQTSSAHVLQDSVSFAPGLQTAWEQVPPPPPLLEPELLPLLEPELLPLELPLLEPELLPLLDPELLPLELPLLEPELLPLLEPLLDPELLLLDPPVRALPLGVPQPVGPS